MKVEILNNKIKISETIKLLIYKENPNLLENLDFDDDEVFLEPLLFAYFNSKKDNLFSNEMLEEILQGYFLTPLKEVILKNSLNKKGTTYIPKLGYFKANHIKPYELIENIVGTSIEILKHSMVILDHIYNTPYHNKFETNQIEVTNSCMENIIFLTNAFQLLKENAKDQFDLIELCCKSCVIFNTNPENINSFATLNAHGIAFFNVYQKDYDEVFFIDDIAHQTAHIILTTFIYVRKNIFKIDENQTIKEILVNTSENRTFKTIYHAHYTYYAIFTCLDNCINNNAFNLKQENEAVARIGFYLKKCKFDLDYIQDVAIEYGGIEKILTKKGLKVYKMVQEKYFKMLEKWGNKTIKYDYTMQPYNFTYSIFLTENNLFKDSKIS